MTVFERRNYQTAILFSILFHLGLVMITLPLQPLSFPGRVEEIAVGLYEIQGDSAPEVAVANPEPKLFVKPEKTRPEPKPPQPRATSPVTDNSKPKSEGSGRNPVKTAPPAPKTPISFGTGSGMVVGFGPEPFYPKNAMNEGIEGQVLVRALIKADGSLDQAELLQSSGDPRLDRTAINSLQREWRFKPNADNYYIDVLFSFEIASGVSYKLVNSATRP